MIQNPFKYGKEVSGEQFYDRLEASRLLYRHLANGSSNVVMYAPRRYGKTSLVKTVLAKFNGEGVRTIYFDMNRVESVEKFCEEYASAVCSAAGKVSSLLQSVTDYLSHLHPTLGIGGDLSVSVRLDFGEKMTSRSLTSVLDLAEQLASASQGRLVVAFDEFQEIANLSSALPLEGVFRSALQAHQNVSYVFLGSKTHLLKRMFGDHSRPFYNSAAVMRLEKPPRAESVTFVKERFAARSVGIDESLAERIVDLAENIPYYLQQLGYFTFESVVANGRDRVETADIDQAVGEIVDKGSDYFAERLNGFSPSQRTLVTALAHEPVAEFVEAYRSRHGLGVSATVHAALKVVRDAGVVEREGDVYRVGDPFFARYVRKSCAEVGGV